MRDTRWRLVLCWGAVIAFFTTPLLLIALVALADFIPSLGTRLGELKFVGTFFQSVTGLVFGLAGLRSFDKYIETKNGIKNGKPPSTPQKSP